MSLLDSLPYKLLSYIFDLVAFTSIFPSAVCMKFRSWIIHNEHAYPLSYMHTVSYIKLMYDGTAGVRTLHAVILCNNTKDVNLTGTIYHLCARENNPWLLKIVVLDNFEELPRLTQDMGKLIHIGIDKVVVHYSQYTFILRCAQRGEGSKGASSSVSSCSSARS